MKKIIFIMVLYIFILSGCAFFQHKEKSNIITTKQVQIDPRVLEPCNPLVLLELGVTDFNEILANVATNSKLFAECSAKQDDSIKLLKQFSNKE